MDAYQGVVRIIRGLRAQDDMRVLSQLAVGMVFTWSGQSHSALGMFELREVESAFGVTLGSAIVQDNRAGGVSAMLGFNDSFGHLERGLSYVVSRGCGSSLTQRYTENSKGD